MFYSISSLKFFLLTIFILTFTGCERNPESSLSDDGIPPAVPSGLNLVYEADGEVWFEWNSPTGPDIRSYIIYRSENDTFGFRKIAERNVNYFFDDSLEYNNTYYYKVAAIDVYGLQSSFSSVIIAKPINKYNPITPKNCSVYGTNWEGSTYFLLSWQKPEESDVNGIEIYRGTVPDFICDSSTFRGETRNNIFEDRGSFNFYENYFYKMIATDKGGLKSAPSVSVNDRILPLVQLISPANDTLLSQVSSFIFRPLPQPAKYRIVVQKNPFTEHIWSAEFELSGVDSLFTFNRLLPLLEGGSRYYWRVEVFTKNGYPNSISKPQSFILE